uniref:Uncharacterized protein n=1 Tax=Anguilla anguilla TaxID=7936 RepID=A0A0E9SSC1_ANGAN
MGYEKMCTQKFLLLLVWCGLLSVAVVVMSVTQLTARHNTQDQAEDKQPTNKMSLNLSLLNPA